MLHIKMVPIESNTFRGDKIRNGFMCAKISSKTYLYVETEKAVGWNYLLSDVGHFPP